MNAALPPPPRSAAGLLASLKPPAGTSGKGPPNAGAVSARLDIIAAEIPDDTERGRRIQRLLKDTASLLRKQSTPSANRAAGAPSRGLTGAHPTWAALTPKNLGVAPEHGDSIRAAILLAHVRFTEERGLQAAEGITGLIDTFDKAYEQRATDALTRLRAPFISALITQKEKAVQDARQLLKEAHEACNTSQAGRQAVEALLTRLDARWEDAPATAPPPFQQPVSESPADDGSLVPNTQIRLEGEEASPAFYPAAPPDDREHGVGNERKAAKRSGYVLATVLRYGGPQTLLANEARAVLRKLFAIAGSALESRPAEAAAACAYITCGLFALGYIDSTQLPLSKPSGTRFSLDLHRGILTGPVPKADRFWKPAQNSALSEFTANPRVDWPIPSELLDVLHRLREMRGAEGADQVLLPQGPEAERARRNILAQLKEVTPRFSESRLRLTLPALLVRRTGNPTLAMYLLGDCLGQSEAPLHYYCIRNDELADRFSEVLVSDLGLSKPTSAIDGRIIGAPLAALPDEVYQKFVEILAKDTRAAHGAAKKQSGFSAYNGLVLYTARMFAAAVGHRCNDDLGELSLGSIDRRGWGGAKDKTVFGRSGFRVMMIPPLVIRQLENLRIEQKRLLDSGRIKDARSLRKAVDGTAPLFILIDESGAARRLTSADLGLPWLDERGLPRNLLRARLRMGLARLGVPEEWIYLQMGHSHNGSAPFDEICQHSVIELSRALSPHLEKHLEQDGWKALPAKTSQMAPLPVWRGANLATPLLRNLATSISDEYRTWKERLKLRQAEFGKKRSESERSDDLLWTSDALMRVDEVYSPNAPSNDVKIEERHVKEWIADLDAQGLTPEAQAYRLRMLRDKVLAFRQSHRWHGVLPPRLFEVSPAPPSVAREHILASRLMEELRDHVLRALVPKTPGTEPWIRLVLLLIADYHVLDESQLRSALEAISTLKTSEKEDDTAILIDVAVSGGVLRATQLTGAACMVARTIPSGPVPTTPQIKLALQSFAPTTLLGATNPDPLRSLFNLQSLAWRVDRPPVLWPQLAKGDLQTLSTKRSTQLLRDEIGMIDELLQRTERGHEVNISGLKPECRPPHVRARQYMDFRLNLHALREPSALDQGLDHQRYSKAKKLCGTTLRSEDLDESVRLLIEFALSLLNKTKRRPRISTIYDYLTGIGAPLLRALDDRSLQDLEDDELDEVFESVIDQTAETRKSGVAARLLRFYRLHSDVLPEADLAPLIALADVEDELVARTSIVTAAEYRCMRSTLNLLRERGEITEETRLYASNALALMYKAGLRSKEVTHRTHKDIFELEGHLFLHVHSTSLGLVKTRTSNRGVELTKLFDEEEILDLRRLIAYAQMRRVDSARATPPLFVFSMLGESAEDYDRRKRTAHDLFKLLRNLLHCVTGDPRMSLHALRHSAASKGILDHWAARDAFLSATAQSAALNEHCLSLGHQKCSTTFGSYWHLTHLVDFRSEKISDRTKATLQHVNYETVKKERQRRKITSPVTAPAGTADRADASPAIALAAAVRSTPKECSDDVIKLLVGTTCGLPIDRVLPRLRIGIDSVVASLRELDGIRLESTLEFLTSESKDQLARDLGVAFQPIQVRKSSIVPGKRWLKQYGGDAALVAKVTGLTAAQARLSLSACRKGFRGLSLGEADAGALIGPRKSNSKSPLAWMAGIHLACSLSNTVS